MLLCVSHAIEKFFAFFCLRRRVEIELKWSRKSIQFNEARSKCQTRTSAWPRGDSFIQAHVFLRNETETDDSNLNKNIFRFADSR